MAQAYSLDASIRTMTGKRVRKLRVNGEIPAVIYGTMVSEPVSVTVAERELVRTYQAIGGSTLLDLQVDGKAYTVYIRNLHMNPIKRQPIHAEFFAPNLTVAMTAHIPVHLIGDSMSPRLVVMHTRDWVELRGLPANLPGGVDVDISGLEEVDDSIFVRDLVLPEGVELVTDPDEMIVRLTEPQLVEEEEEVEAEEGEEIEGEEAAEDAGGDTESDDSDESGE
ncbi:50S ribosomal protein L25/general stress protein Ctc [soil metagenome]